MKNSELKNKQKTELDYNIMLNEANALLNLDFSFLDFCIDSN